MSRAIADKRRVVVLGSASPARLKLLRGAGIEPAVRVSEVDEEAVTASALAASPTGALAPSQISQLLATAKAVDVAWHLDGDSTLGTALVVGCDSVLEWDGRDWGKPGGPEEAVRRLRAMRGTTGILHTGHCVIDLSDGRRVEAIGSTEVGFAQMSDDEIDAYVATGEPLNVAGSFTLDGLAAPYVSGIVGDPSNVIGLSLPLLRKLVNSLDVQWMQLWSRTD